MSGTRAFVYAKAKKNREAEVCSLVGPRGTLGYAFDRRGRRYFVFGNGCVKSQARLLAAILVGRPLEPMESVHHIDGDRANDCLANFQVVPTVAHQAFHSFVDRGRTPPPELARAFRFVREAA